MDIAIKRPESVFEVFIRNFLRKKEDLVYREEKVIEKGISMRQALDRIGEELCAEINGRTLHIIDAYFSPSNSIGTPECCADELFAWACQCGISKIVLHNNKEGNEFAKSCIERFDGQIPFTVEKCTRKIHDRFWVVEKEGCYAGVMVGSSLSGIGKNFTVVCKICDKDLEHLIDILHDYDIEI